MPFERGFPDKNHSWDLMRSSWPGSSDPRQTAAAAQRREHRRGQVPGLAWCAASGRTHPAGPSPCWARRIPHGPPGSRPAPAPAPSKLRRALEQNERTGRNLATARVFTTKCVERKPKSVNNHQKEGKGNWTKQQRREERRRAKRRSANWAERKGINERMKKRKQGEDRTKRVNGEGGNGGREKQQTIRKKKRTS